MTVKKSAPAKAAKPTPAKAEKAPVAEDKKKSAEGSCGGHKQL